MTRTSNVTAIVLAGRRDGVVDPLAAAHGVSDKCLVPVLGTSCIEHVLAVLADAPHIGPIIVSINDPAILAGLPVAARTECGAGVACERGCRACRAHAAY